MFFSLQNTESFHHLSYLANVKACWIASSINFPSAWNSSGMGQAKMVPAGRPSSLEVSKGQIFQIWFLNLTYECSNFIEIRRVELPLTTRVTGKEAGKLVGFTVNYRIYRVGFLNFYKKNKKAYQELDCLWNIQNALYSCADDSHRGIGQFYEISRNVEGWNK